MKEKTTRWVGGSHADAKTSVIRSVRAPWKAYRGIVDFPRSSEFEQRLYFWWFHSLLGRVKSMEMPMLPKGT